MTGRPHRRLILWQKAMDFVVETYKVAARFPSAEKFGIASQIQRAAVSIPSNIAEGAARKSRREYLQFLYIARGSISELDTQLEIALRLGYMDEQCYASAQERLEELSRMLSALITALSK